MANVINALIVGFSVLFSLVVFNVLLKKSPVVSLIATVLIDLGVFNLIKSI